LESAIPKTLKYSIFEKIKFFLFDYTFPAGKASFVALHIFRYYAPLVYYLYIENFSTRKNYYFNEKILAAQAAA